MKFCEGNSGRWSESKQWSNSKRWGWSIRQGGPSTWSCTNRKVLSLRIASSKFGFKKFLLAARTGGSLQSLQQLSRWNEEQIVLGCGSVVARGVGAETFCLQIWQNHWWNNKKKTMLKVMPSFPSWPGGSVGWGIIPYTKKWYQVLGVMAGSVYSLCRRKHRMKRTFAR